MEASGRIWRLAIGCLLPSFFLACSVRPSDMAPGVQRTTLRQVRFGMTETALTSLLGPPLEIRRFPQPPPERRLPQITILRYAQASELHYGDRFSPLSGILIFAELADGQLRELVVADAATDAVCICSEAACPADWLLKCEPNLPS